MKKSSLTSKERARLRSLAHPLKPILQVGAAGVSEALLPSVEEAFNTRELLKVRVLEAAPESPRETADRIAAALDGVEVVQTIGRTIVLYRPEPDDPGPRKGGRPDAPGDRGGGGKRTRARRDRRG